MANTTPASLDPVRILCAADAAFAASLCVTLESVLEHHPKDRGIIIYVLGFELPENERRKIEGSLCANHPDFPLSSLHWLSPDRRMLLGLPVRGHLRLESYSRLLAPFVLPNDCQRVLYLDSDMVIVSDLSPLYDSSYDGNAVHAARDISVGTVSASTGVFNFAELGIPPDNHYFNSGVLLMHLDIWRKNSLSENIFRYLNLHMGAVHWQDQGGMNAILHNSWTEIDPVWNQTRAILYPELWKKLGYSSGEWRRVNNHPRIVHFTGPDKPWLPHTELIPLPRYARFFNVLKRTPYYNSFKGPQTERLVGVRVYSFLWRALRQIQLRVPQGLKRRRDQ